MFISKKEHKNDISNHICWYLFYQNFCLNIQNTQICEKGSAANFPDPESAPIFGRVVKEPFV